MQSDGAIAVGLRLLKMHRDYHVQPTVKRLMPDQQPREACAEAVRSALMKVATNVAKHIVQRSSWSEDDKCFQVDLREAEAELLTVVGQASSRYRIALERLRDGAIYFSHDEIRKIIMEALGDA